MHIWILKVDSGYTWLGGKVICDYFVYIHMNSCFFFFLNKTFPLTLRTREDLIKLEPSM